MGTTEIIFVSVIGAVLLFIAVLYCINSVKINKKAKKAEKPKEAKKEEEKKTDEKVEVKPEISAEKPIERAIKEANVEFQIKEAFEKIEQERIDYEKTAKVTDKSIGGKLKLDRGDFRTELQKTLEDNGTYERNVISSETNRMKSETAQMDYEIRPQSIANVTENYENDIDKQIAEEYMNNHQPRQKTLKEEINGMSPEAKAMMLNDLLKRKYWFN